MIARGSVILITLGLFLGALYVFNTHRAPCQTLITVEAAGITETRLYNPKEILSIDIDGEGTLYLTQEEGSPTVRVEADQALMPYIDIAITDKTLRITRKTAKKSTFAIPAPQFFVFVPDIAAISARGTAQIITQNKLKVDSLDANTRGSAVIQALIDTKQLDIQSHGASSIIITGSATEQHVQLHGSARYEAGNLESQECSIEASGATHAQIFVTQRVFGAISQNSIVTFSGSPQIFVSKSGTATIKNHSPEISSNQKTE